MVYLLSCWCLVTESCRLPSVSLSYSLLLVKELIVSSGFPMFSEIPCSEIQCVSLIQYVPHACVLSRVQLFATPQTVALSMGFPKQEYRNGLPFPPPGGFPTPRIKPVSLALQADSLPLSHLGRPNI